MAPGWTYSPLFSEMIGASVVVVFIVFGISVTVVVIGICVSVLMVSAIGYHFGCAHPRVAAITIFSFVTTGMSVDDADMSVTGVVVSVIGVSVFSIVIGLSAADAVLSSVVVVVVMGTMSLLSAHVAVVSIMTLVINRPVHLTGQSFWLLVRMFTTGTRLFLFAAADGQTVNSSATTAAVTAARCHVGRRRRVVDGDSDGHGRNSSTVGMRRGRRNLKLLFSN